MAIEDSRPLQRNRLGNGEGGGGGGGWPLHPRLICSIAKEKVLKKLYCYYSFLLQ